MRAKFIRDIIGSVKDPEYNHDELRVNRSHSIEDLVDIIHSADVMLSSNIEPLLHTKAEYKEQKNRAIKALKKYHGLSSHEILDLVKESYQLNEAFDVLTWSRKNMDREMADNVEEAHEGGYGEKLQTSLLKIANKDELIDWFNKNFEYGRVEESLDFTRGRSSKKAIDVGLSSVIGKDLDLFKEKMDEMLGDLRWHSYTSSSSMPYSSQGPLKKGTYSASIRNKYFGPGPASQEFMDDLKDRIEKWIEANTKFERSEVRMRTRSYRPWGDEMRELIHELSVDMNLYDTVDSYNKWKIEDAKNES